MLLPGLLLFGRRRPHERLPHHSHHAVTGSAAVLLLAVVCLATPARASSEEEALRQLEFARVELSQALPDRALQSAESALRLCPGCYDAMVVKALAYEALGNARLAESLLLAYIELVGGSRASEEATSNLARIQAGLSTPRPTSDRRARRAEASAGIEVTTRAVAALEPSPYRDRVKAALRAGQCQVARSAAAELTLAAPEEVEGWRMAGDAARCSGDMREAVLAYRRYQAKGGTEGPVLEMIDALAKNLGAVEVRLRLADGSSVPKVRLDTGSEFLAPVAIDDELLRFSDLAVGVTSLIAVTGRGLQAEYHEIPPLAPGEVHPLEVTPVWVGVGHVQIAEHSQEQSRTTLVTADEVLDAEPGQNIEVTAGTVLAVVVNDNGALEVELEVKADEQVAFDPTRHLPASLTVVGLPAGADVRVFVETSAGEMVEQTISLAPGVGEIDEETGVRLAPPTSFLSLRGGSGGVFASHPSLGNAPLTLVLESGGVNGATFPWRTLDGVVRVQAAYESWRTVADLAKKGRVRTAVLGVASGILAGVGAGLLVGAITQQGLIADAKGDGVEATIGRTNTDALDAAWEAHGAARRAQDGLLVAGSISLGLAGAGFVITIVSGVSAHKAIAKVGSWDPEAVR